MDVRPACFVFISIMLISSADANPFSNPNDQIEISNYVGKINATQDAMDKGRNNLHWHFDNTIPKQSMIRIQFKGEPSPTALTLLPGGKKKFVKAGKSCYFFALKQEKDHVCKTTAEKQICNYVKLDTTNLNLHYQSTDAPKFTFTFLYVNCEGTPLPIISATAPPSTRPSTFSSTTTTTTSARAATTALSIGNDVTRQTVANGSVNTPTNNAEGRIAPSPGEVTTTKSTRITNGQSGGVDTNVIIIVAVVVILIVLVVSVLLICGKRFRRYQKQIKEIHSGAFSNAASSAAPAGDQLYEEIAPQLPTRNTNMREPGYEVPLCAMDATPESSKDRSSLTVENELYLKLSSGEAQTTSQSKTSKYGTVENELYREDSAKDNERNDNIIGKNARGVSLTNELYTTTNLETSPCETELTAGNGMPVKPQNSVANKPEMTVRDSSTMDNVLYNM